MHWYLQVLKKYAVFSGRARRKEYWMFVLFNIIIAFVLELERFAGVVSESGQSDLAAIYQLTVLIPSISVLVRRMHDTDHSGWWVLVPIANLVLAIREGQHGDNRFGPDPKRTPAEDSVAASTPNAAAFHVQIKTQAAGQTPNSFCIRCGTQFPDMAAYCPKCGTARTA
ncbi:MAG: DUF805 domain-containing protein [Hydrogenophilaceae bacterium]|nr:DUF805 domain-containing protein [Hydrogenophilaceae bacterium]